MGKAMKKLIAIAVAALATLTIFSACSKKDFDSKFADPSKSTTVSCDKLMTGVFRVGCFKYRSFGYATYWRLYTWEGVMAQLTQQKGFTNESGSVYYVADSYATDRWNNFYDMLAQFRQMQNKFESETDTEKAVDILFLNITEAYLYEHLAQLCDAFGPVPFTEAGYLGITSDLQGSYPAYDSDEYLYGLMIDRLGVIYNELNSYNETLGLQELVAQDPVNGGDLDKWVRYVNSLRLRLANHVAAKGSLVSKAKQAISECLGRKLVTDLKNGIFGNVSTVEMDAGNAFWQWYREGYAGNGANVTASQAIIDAMQITGTDDPRLKIFYHPNAAGRFVGKSVKESKAVQEANDLKGSNDWSKRVYSTLDSVTFIANGQMKSPIITPAEIYFIEAEAYQKNYVSGGEAKAKAAFKEGVKYSIQQYFESNINSVAQGGMSTYSHYRAKSVPTDAEIYAYAEDVWSEYEDKMEAIMTQKWLHLGIADAHESWTDIRRTGYPKLGYPTDGSAQTAKNIIQRVLYPLIEKTNNTDNYNAATASFKDDNSTVLFWATELKNNIN